MMIPQQQQRQPQTSKSTKQSQNSSSSAVLPSSYNHHHAQLDENRNGLSPNIPLSIILDVSIVDTYLLQTYIVPQVINALQQPWFQQLTTFVSSWLLFPHRFQRHINESNHNNHHKNNFHDIAISRIVRCMVPFLTVLVTHGITPGMRQMNLQFTTASSSIEGRPENTSNTSRGRNIQNKLILYGILQYIIPELLYPLLRYCVQTMLDHRYHQIQKRLPPANDADTTIPNTKHENCPNRYTNTDQAESHQPPATPVSVLRQYQILQLLQNVLNGIDTKVIPIIQFLTILLCWSGATGSTSTTTNNVAMILSGLSYTTLLPQHHSPSSSSTIAPFLFFTSMAHRRWLTHHIWETIRTILLPSVTVLSVLQPHVFLTSSYRSLSLALIQRLQRVMIRLRVLAQRTFPSLMVMPTPLPSSSLIPPTRAFQDKNPSDNTHNNSCLFCQQIPPTIAVQAHCHTCDRPQQIYCYACFYQHCCIDSNHRLYDDDEYQEHTHRDSVSPTTKSQHTSTSTANTISHIITKTKHRPIRSSYRIPIQPRNVRSFFAHCGQCHKTIDTVTFVY